MRAEPIAEDRVVPAYRSVQEMRIRIDQQLLRIEAMAAIRVISAVNPISVELSRTEARQIAVPIWLVRQVRKMRVGYYTPPRGIEQAGSTELACAENSAKLVPRPSQFAPSGKGTPSSTFRVEAREAVPRGPRLPAPLSDRPRVGRSKGAAARSGKRSGEGPASTPFPRTSRLSLAPRRNGKPPNPRKSFVAKGEIEPLEPEFGDVSSRVEAKAPPSIKHRRNFIDHRRREYKSIIILYKINQMWPDLPVKERRGKGI